MQIWTGLGNPGPQYAMHRHNIGFMACDVIAEMHGFGPAQKKFSGWVQEGRIGTAKVLLLKPATFMNESGRAVGEALRFYKLDTDALTVFHDELDLAPFKVKVRTGGGRGRSLHERRRNADAGLARAPGPSERLHASGQESGPGAFFRDPSGRRLAGLFRLMEGLARPTRPLILIRGFAP